MLLAFRGSRTMPWAAATLRARSLSPFLSCTTVAPPPSATAAATAAGELLKGGTRALVADPNLN